MSDIICCEESYRIMGACFEVNTEKGYGFWEAVFHECLELEFGDQGNPFVARPKLALTYEERPLKQTHTPDFIRFGKIVIEIKAVSALTAEHRAQVHNYLRAIGHWLGLLVNFGHFPKVGSERIAR